MTVPDSKRTFGEVPEDFRQLVIRAALKEEEPVRVKRFSAALVTAILIIALACTALAAITLSRSPEYEATRSARALMRSTYALDAESLGMFNELVREDGEGWTIEYQPKEFEEKVGSYSVYIPKEGDGRTITWSFDGETVTDTADMDAAHWGQAQIAKLAHARKEHEEKRKEMTEELGPIEHWSLAERAALYEDWLDQDYLLAEYGVDVIPEPGDIPEAEATRRMWAAVKEKFGVTDEALAEYDAMLWLTRQAGTGERSYMLVLSEPGTSDGLSPYNSFRVRMFTPSGQITECAWDVAPEKRTLPDGPLDTYSDAVEEYVRSGAFRALDDESRQEVAGRIMEAGLGELIGDVPYATPDARAIARGEAQEIAQDALAEQYALTEEMLALFEQRVSYVGEGEGAAWVVAYSPPAESEFSGKLGSYQVILRADSGDVSVVSWSNEDKADGKTYTKEELGKAPAWDAAMLPWFIEFDEKRAVLEEAFPGEWEDLARLHTLYREAGFDHYNYALPGEEDIPCEDALAITREALREDYGVTDKVFDAHVVVHSFSIADPDKPIWEFNVFMQDSEECYYVVLDGRTGEVLSNTYYTVGNG